MPNLGPSTKILSASARIRAGCASFRTVPLSSLELRRARTERECSVNVKRTQSGVWMTNKRRRRRERAADSDSGSIPREEERERERERRGHRDSHWDRRKYTDTSRSRDHLVPVTSEHLRTHAGIFITGISRRLIIVIENSDVHTHSAALSHSDSSAGVAVPFYLEGLSFREGSFPRSRQTRLHRRGG